jgi:hypothetical protein
VADPSSRADFGCPVWRDLNVADGAVELHRSPVGVPGPAADDVHGTDLEHEAAEAE